MTLILTALPPPSAHRITRSLDFHLEAGGTSPTHNSTRRGRTFSKRHDAGLLALLAVPPQHVLLTMAFDCTFRIYDSRTGVLRAARRHPQVGVQYHPKSIFLLSLVLVFAACCRPCDTVASIFVLDCCPIVGSYSQLRMLLQLLTPNTVAVRRASASPAPLTAPATVSCSLATTTAPCFSTA